MDDAKYRSRGYFYSIFVTEVHNYARGGQDEMGHERVHKIGTFTKIYYHIRNFPAKYASAASVYRKWVIRSFRPVIARNTKRLEKKGKCTRLPNGDEGYGWAGDRVTVTGGYGGHD